MSAVLAPRVSRFAPAILIAGCLVYFGLAEGGIFFSLDNLRDYVVSLSVLGVLVIGLTAVMQAGEFDLAFPNVIVLSGIVAGVLLGHMPALLAILLALAAGAAVGAVSGLLVSRVGVNSFIGTLGIGTFVTGLVILINDGDPVRVGSDGVWGFFGRDELLGISLLFWLFAAVAVAALVLSRRSRFGRQVEAVGANIEGARLLGIRTATVKTSAFVLVGVCAAIAGLMLTARLGGLSTEAGPPFLFQAYGVVFLGALIDPDGRFSVGGTLSGLAAIALLNNGLTVIGVNVLTQSLATGGVLLAAVLLARGRIKAGVGP